jgi:hypothetical protein
VTAPLPPIPRDGAVRRSWPLTVADWIRTAPATYLWLVVLAGTTTASLQLQPATRRHLLLVWSTNLHNLGRDPVQVLLASAFWTDTGSLLVYAVLFTVFLAPVEHWLGTGRWVLVALIGHIGATLISVGNLAADLSAHAANPALADDIDVGVSYGFAALCAILAYRLPRPWRWIYVAGGLTLVLVPVIGHGTVTDVGHLSAVLLGLLCYPLVRRRTTSDLADHSP